MPIAEIRGKQLYYEIHGNGEPVVLLHHGFASGAMWKAVYPKLVDAGYQAVVIDRRGFGKSEPGPDFEQYYLSDGFRLDNVVDMAELVSHLGLDSFHVVGQCEGGVVGVDYAATYPHHVMSLVVASTLCYSVVTMTEFNALKFPRAFHELDPELRDKFIEWHGPDWAEPLYQYARTHGGEYGIAPFDIRPRLPHVICPAMVLYPDRSGLFEVEQGVALYRGLAKGELAVIPRCGHNTYDRRPDDYVRHVLDFLDRVRRSRTEAPEDFSMTCLAPAPAR